MRDKRFVAEHRGGNLRKEHHHQLMQWACECAEHIIIQFYEKPDLRLIEILGTGKYWITGKATVGDARKAVIKAISLAKEYSNPIDIAIARASGHAVATAHMADHSLGAALYALKALKIAGKPLEPERKWQNEQLPSGIRELVLSSRMIKEKSFKLV